MLSGLFPLVLVCVLYIFVPEGIEVVRKSEPSITLNNCTIQYEGRSWFYYHTFRKWGLYRVTDISSYCYLKSINHYIYAYIMALSSNNLDTAIGMLGIFGYSLVNIICGTVLFAGIRLKSQFLCKLWTFQTIMAFALVHISNIVSVASLTTESPYSTMVTEIASVPLWVLAYGWAILKVFKYTLVMRANPKYNEDEFSQQYGFVPL